MDVKPRSLRMIRWHLRDLPEFPVPDGYRLRWYRRGDEEAWLDIHRDADFYNRLDLKRYREEFGFDEEKLTQRQAFLTTSKGEVIGTASAWHGIDDAGIERGRLHWVAIFQHYQGNGLAKPLVGAVLKRLFELGHHSAYLTTGTQRLPALHLYHKFGFEPSLVRPGDREAWRLVEEACPWVNPFLEAES